MDLRLIVAASTLLVLGCNRERHTDKVGSPLKSAVVLFEIRQPAKALVECDRMLAKEPNHFRGLLLRGKICEALGDQVGALTAFTKAFRLRPLDAEARFHLNRLDLVGVAKLRVEIAATDPEVESDSISDQPSQIFEEQDVVANNKSYRSPDNKSARTETSIERQQPTDSSANTNLTRLRLAIAEGQKRDSAAKRVARIGQRLFWVAGPMDREQPLQVTRFDLGMGVNGESTDLQQNTATTGRRTSFVVDEAIDHPKVAFVAQPISFRESKGTRGLAYRSQDFTIRHIAADNYQFGGICQDGIDNNGNGLVDAADPVCWIDGVNPGSYSPYLDEGSEFLPPEFLATPSNINARPE